MNGLEPRVVAAAAERLAGVVNRTPVMTSRTLDEQSQNQILLKCENFQRAGAFKFRGAYNTISQLSTRERDAGIITHSSGNHAQGVALAAKLLGVKATVVMPEDAPAIKREATLAYGATVIPCKASEREKTTENLIAAHGYTLVHPYDNDHIIAGQGTAAWELFDEVGSLDLLFVPVGGGGLISGSALAAAIQSPGCRVIGVEPEIAADAKLSWQSGKIATLEFVPQTIADGLRPLHIGERNLSVMRKYVADMITVRETAIVEALVFLWQRLKIVVEPSAAVALAPVLFGDYDVAGRRLGVILSGGNVDVLGFQDMVEELAGTQTSQRSTQTAKETLDPPAKPRILVGDSLDEAALSLLRQVAVVDVFPGLSAKKLQNIIGRYHALVIGDSTQVSGEVIEYGFHLRIIASTGKRLDNIDVSAARALGVEVLYSPGGDAVSIAEYTLSLLLTLTKLRSDGESTRLEHGLAGKTLGLIGFGRIGRQVALRALAFDMRVLVNQPRLTPELALAAGVEVTDLRLLLAESDFVSLHVPFKAETDALIGREELALMKASAILINIAHTELVDDQALLEALDENILAGAALARFEAKVPGGEVRPPVALRQHPRVLEARHITTFRNEMTSGKATVKLARRILDGLRVRRPSESLSLDVVSIEDILPHEQHDDKRVTRLMSRLEDDGRLVNPPVVTKWNRKYVILDGATRFTALKRLDFGHVIVQLVPADSQELKLHTWYHVILDERPFSAMIDVLSQIDGLSLTPLPADQIRGAFSEKSALCYFLDRDGEATLASCDKVADWLAVMNDMVARYTEWATVERTLLTDLERLLGQFPRLLAVAVFPQFAAETIFEVASRGEYMPAGLTRFVIPGRILRLNADLERLKRDETLLAKRAWLNSFLEEKLARSRLRYYQEPVVLLDE